MKLWVGLGNPGAQYAHNRHNIGFMAVDRIAADHGFGPWRSRFQGQVSEGTLGGEKIILLKPGTFMNLSGQSVAEAVRFHKIALADMTVFHDEIDLAPARIKFKSGGGHAGHNGLRSIHGHLGDAYDRVRLGVGHPGHKDAVPGYVLKDFAKADSDWRDALLHGISDGAAALATGDAPKFLNAVALRLTPPRPSATRPSATRPNATRPSAPKPLAPAPVAAPAPINAPAPELPPDRRTVLQKLADKFR